jgi:hypothetical protein
VSFFSGIIFFIGAFVVSLNFSAHAGAFTYALTAVFILWAIIASSLEIPATRARLERFVRVAHLPYTATLDRVLRGLPRMLLPGTVSRDPPPSGLLAWLEYWITPRARDDADLIALSRNPWSWPVMDAALKIAILYPITLAIGQAAFGGGAGLGGFELVPPDAPRWIAAAAFCGIVLLMVLRFLASATSKGVFEKLLT